jgi:hypothetical protein
MLIASACSTVTPPPAYLAGEYVDREHDPPLFVSLSADGQYTRWWVEPNGLSISRPWVYRVQPSGKETVTLEEMTRDHATLSFIVEAAGGTVVLVGTDLPLRLKRTPFLTEYLPGTGTSLR